MKEALRPESHDAPRRCVAGAALLFAFAALAAHAQQPASCAVVPFPATQKTLANGLRVIVVPTALPDVVSLQIDVAAGPRIEIEEGSGGLAHLFEHLSLSGTPRYPAAAYRKLLAGTMARQSAYTGNDTTHYQTTFFGDDLETIVEAEADRFRNLRYTEQQFAETAAAVVEEAQRNALNPATRLFELQRQKAFAVHPYRHQPMGSPSDLDDLPRRFAASRTFFERWYRPEHTTLLLAGDVDAEAAMALVEKHWGGWKRGDFTARPPVEPETSGPTYAHVATTVQSMPWVTVAFRSPAFSSKSKDFAALETLLDLYFGPTSTLRRELVDEQEIADQFGVDVGSSADPSLATIYARVRSARHALHVRNRILQTIARARAGEATAARLETARSSSRYALARALNDTESIAGALARYARFERRFETLNEYACVVASLTPEDLTAAARRFLTDSSLLVTTLSHQPLPASMATLPPIDSMLPESSKSAAGADVDVLVQRTALPQLTMKLVFNAGSAHDPAGKAGLAALSAAMITEAGSGALAPSELEAELLSIAGELSAQVDREVTTFTLRVHRDNWRRLLDLTLPALLAPTLRLEDFRRVRTAQNLALQDLLTRDEEQLARELLQQRLLGAQYGHPSVGSANGIEAITIDDVRSFLRTHYTTHNLTVGISGDVPETMLEYLRGALRRLPGGTTPRITANTRVPPGASIDVVAKERGRATVAIGMALGVTRSDRDFAAMAIAREWLAARLRTQLAARGLEDGTTVTIEADPDRPSAPRRRQIFEIVLPRLASDQAHFALKLVIHELRRLVRDGIPESAVMSTRDTLLQSLAFETRTPELRLGRALDARWYGIDENALRAALRTIDDRQVNRALRAELKPERFQAVVLTPAAGRLREALVAESGASIRYETAQPALAEEDRAIGSLRFDLDSRDVRLVTLSTLFVD